MVDDDTFELAKAVNYLLYDEANYGNPPGWMEAARILRPAPGKKPGDWEAFNLIRAINRSSLLTRLPDYAIQLAVRVIERLQHKKSFLKVLKKRITPADIEEYHHRQAMLGGELK